VAVGAHHDRIGMMLLRFIEQFVDDRPLDVQGEHFEPFTDQAVAEFSQLLMLLFVVARHAGAHRHRARFEADKIRLGFADVQYNQSGSISSGERFGRFEHTGGDVGEIDGDEDRFHGMEFCSVGVFSP